MKKNHILDLVVILCLLISAIKSRSEINHIKTRSTPLGSDSPITENQNCSGKLAITCLVGVNLNKPRPWSNYKTGHLWYVSLLLLLHDTETNPGPDNQHTPIDRCGNCNKRVRWGQQAVCCDRCDTWYHINCQQVSEAVYLCLDSNNISWECLQCGMPNFSSGLFNSSGNIPLSPNIYDTINSPSCDDSLGEPLATSSPVQVQSRVRKNNNPKRSKPLTLLNVNCQSISPKKGEFQNLVDSTQPDIVIATETWLTDGVHHDGEIGEINRFSHDYKIYRRDRKDGYGGVLVAIKNDIISSRADELETDAEMVWVQISITGMKTLYICGMYRPHENDEKGQEEFEISLSRIATHQNANIWIAGDLNFPGINWVSNDTKPSCRHPTIHQDFLDCLEDHNLQQMVKVPTRDQNILDLFITNNTTKINKVQVIPGISDHHAVIVEGNLLPTKTKQQKRQVPLYKKQTGKV